MFSAHTPPSTTQETEVEFTEIKELAREPLKTGIRRKQQNTLKKQDAFF